MYYLGQAGCVILPTADVFNSLTSEWPTLLWLVTV